MVTEFKLPDLGEGITEGEVRKWLVKEGDSVKRDQSLAELETDKAVVEMPSPAEGKILKIHHPEGSVVKVGEVLVTIGAEGETAATPEARTPSASAVVPEAHEAIPPEAPVVTKQAATAPETRKPSVSVVGELPEAPEAIPPEAPIVAKQVPSTEKAILVLPAVRQLASQLGVDLASVKGTGPEGRITEDDVRKSQIPPKTPPKIVPKFDVFGYVERRPIRGVRRTTAKRMVESLAKAAQVTAMEVVDVTELVALREREKVALKESKNIHLTYMPFIIKAVVEALRETPIMNSSYDEESEEVVIKKYYNIGYAVATEDGLLVPVLKGADQKSIVELAQEVERLTELSNSRKIDLGDLKGGTFTITNYGVFGGTYGTPIINYPEVAILGTGKIADTPLVVGTEIKIRKTMHLSLSFDHRVMDGADAAKFMNSLKKYLEDPELLLISMESSE
jgi:pyruvate dehydrogenase E2 component (dihydrolipoamide acetyltransferase)